MSEVPFPFYRRESQDTRSYGLQVWSPNLHPDSVAELWVESQKPGVLLLHGLSTFSSVLPRGLLGRWWTSLKGPKECPVGWGELGRVIEVVGGIPVLNKQWCVCHPSGIFLSTSPSFFQWFLTCDSGRSPHCPSYSPSIEPTLVTSTTWPACHIIPACRSGLMVLRYLGMELI